MKSLMQAFAALAMIALLGGQAFAQLEAVGGPYTADANTILLLHFDGNLTNAAATQGKTAAAAVPHSTNLATKISYFDQTGSMAGLGKSIRLDNSSINDSTYLTIPDTATLSLTGNWTIEAWANIFTFGSGASDYRWVPRVLMKPGNTTFWVNPNFWLEMWGDNRLFHAGYAGASGTYYSVTSPNNMFVPGQWVHLTFIRDTSRQFIAVMVHDANKQLIGYLTKGIDKNDAVTTTKTAVHIGWAGAIENGANASTDSWLDGFIDEVRISNVVRNFAGPPVVQNAKQLPNQSAALTSYPVSMSVFPLNAGGSLTTVECYYRADTVSAFTKVTLSAAGNNTYTGTIPQQAGGKIVQYYYKATDNNSMTTLSPVDAENLKSYYSFAVFTPNSMTLEVTFEEGPSGKPIDHSPNKATIITYPDFKYSTDHPMNGGLYSLNVKASDGIKIDSNFIKASSPFLAAEEFTLDCWVKADSADRHAVRIIINPSKVDDWNNANFELSFRNGGGGVPVFTGRYWYIDLSAAVVLQDTIPGKNHVGKWRHITLERNSSNLKFAMTVRDENDVLLYKQIKDAPKAPIMAGAPLVIGRSHFMVDNQYYVGPYRGLIDNVRVYNYPKSGITSAGKEPVALAHEFSLSQNYPNPFNPSTEIEFSIPMFQQVSLVVYDILGKQVKTLVNDQRHAGTHRVTWNGTNDFGSKIASGVYFYRLTAGNLTKVSKMMMLK